MTTHILNIIKSSGLNIVDENKLIEYINFCIEKNQCIKNNHTEHHHILPKSKHLFPKYKDLKQHKWNGTYLTYEDHYMAHQMLALSIDNKYILFAWNAMNSYKSFENEKIMIDKDNYSLLRQRHRDTVINYNKTRTLSDISRKKMSETMKELHPTTFCNTSGYTVVYDTQNNVYLQVSSEEYKEMKKGVRFIHNTKNKVSVRFWDGTTSKVSQEVYDNDELIGGSVAKRYIITDHQGNITKTMKFRKFIKDNNISKTVTKYINKGIITEYTLSNNQFKQKTDINGWSFECLD